MKQAIGPTRLSFYSEVSFYFLVITILCLTACTGRRSTMHQDLSDNLPAKKYPPATADLEQQTRKTPNKARPWYLLANAYYEERKFSEAARVFEKAIALQLPQEELEDAYDKLGWSYYKMGSYDKSIAVFEKALKLFPGWTAPLIGKASSLRQKGQYHEALSEFNRILATNSRNLSALNNRGWTYYMMRNYSMALRDFQDTEALSRSRVSLRANALNGQGWCYYMRAMFQTALAKFEEAASTAPQEYVYGLWDAYRGMAFSQAGLGNFARSYALLGKAKTALNYDPNHDLALLHYAAGDREGTWHYLGGPGYVGLALQVVSIEGAQILYVAKVNKNGPADRAGILPGDIIVAVGGRPITGLDSFGKAVKSAKPGSRISMVVSRRGVDRQVSIIIQDASKLIVNDPLLAPLLQGRSRISW